MGGFSIKCPLCSKWFIAQVGISDHMRDKHGLKDIMLEGVAGTAKLVAATYITGAPYAITPTID